MRAIFCSIGTRGDVFPILCVARAFQDMGGKSLCVVNPADSKLAKSLNLRYVCSGVEYDMDKFIGGHHELCSSVGTELFIDEAVLPHMKDQYLSVKQLLIDFRPDVVVAHFLCFGAEWAAHEAKIEHVTVILAPITIFSLDDPSYSIWEFRYLPRVVRATLIKLGKSLFARDINSKLASLAKKIPLDFHKKDYFSLKSNSALHLALWSKRFRDVAKDDNKNLRICGFFDMPLDGQSISQKAQQFILENGSPIIVGFGSSARNVAAPVYEIIAFACEELNIPCLLIGIDDVELDNRSDLVCTSYFEPFDKLFSQARMLVHHGGASTMSAAFRSAKPSLIIPFMFDQFDNAQRSCKLGVAKALSHRDVTIEKVRDSLKEILDDKQMAMQSQALCEAISFEKDGAKVAASELSNLIKKKFQENF